MSLIGLDFDNTLVCYDNLFYEIAVRKNLIPKKIKKTKNSVRDYLKSLDKENIFTLLQGEVYGYEIKNAKIQPDLISVLKCLKDAGHKLFIVSHKTKLPISGYPYNFHDAAKNWLENNQFFCEDDPLIDIQDVYFEISFEKKIKRIKNLGCTHFIDDLPVVLEKLSGNIIKLLYDKNNEHCVEDSSIISFSRWPLLLDIL